MTGTPDTMIFWLATAARYLRERGNRKQIEVAARLGLDQSTIYRFEQGKTWPRNTDEVVAAYADELEIPDARDIWALGQKWWVENGQAPSIEHAEHDSLAGAVQELLTAPAGGAIPAPPAVLKPAAKASARKRGDRGGRGSGGAGSAQRRAS